jgi:hypothetical protein
MTLFSLKKTKAGKVFDRDPPLVVDLMEKALQFASADRDVFLGVMSTIADEYNTLVNKRNNLLHATWFIGFQGVAILLAQNFMWVNTLRQNRD